MERQTGERLRRVSESATSSGAKTKRRITKPVPDHGKRRPSSLPPAIGAQFMTSQGQPLTTETPRLFPRWQNLSLSWQTCDVVEMDVPGKQSRSRAQDWRNCREDSLGAKVHCA